VVTSGFRDTSGQLESLYPRGIPIGTVKTVNASEIATYQRVHVQPFADFRRMDYVQVLTSRPGPPRSRSSPTGPCPSRPR